MRALISVCRLCQQRFQTAPLSGVFSPRTLQLPASFCSKAGRGPADAAAKTRNEGLSVDAATEVKVVPKMKTRKPSLDMTKQYTANIYITTFRAKRQYLMEPEDLKVLWHTTRRSPFDGNPPMTVYLRSEVERAALAKWGSSEKLTNERLRRLTAYTGLDEVAPEEQRTAPYTMGLSAKEGVVTSESAKVVWMAIGINSFNTAIKGMAYLHTGSHSMFAETVHSFADTGNQLILAFGIWKSVTKPDFTHPYGWYNFTYVASLISGVGFFFMGAGVAWYHGVMALMNPAAVESLPIAISCLGISLCTEGVTLVAAFKALQKQAAAAGLSVWQFIRIGHDPALNVVFMEDTAAVIGVGIAGTAMTASYLTEHTIFDAAGSFLIGGLLSTVAVFIVWTNTENLVGRSIPSWKSERIRAELEGDAMIRALHDVKATQLGQRRVRFKAEVDFDGRQITQHYLDQQDPYELLKEVQSITNVEDLDRFLLKHGEGVVDQLGAQVDRIEKNLKTKFPDVRHVDLEVL